MKTWLSFMILMFGFLNMSIGQQTGSSAISADLGALYTVMLQSNPIIKRQEVALQQKHAGRQLARSTFDYQAFSDVSLSHQNYNLFDLDPRHDLLNGSLNTNSFMLSGGVQRTFRTGTTVRTSLDYTRIGDSNPMNAFGENIGAFQANNLTRLSASISQPLMRGRGKDIVTISETLSEIDIESQDHFNVFVSAQQVFDLLINYWQYKVSSRSLDIYRENEMRVSKVLEITEELVQADKKPKSDLVQIQADLKDKERQTILSIQQYKTIQQNLARTIGLEALEGEQLSLPLTEFPDVIDTERVKPLEYYTSLAHRNRNDIKSFKKSLEGLEQLKNRAKNSLLPQLDLSVFASYSGTNIGNEVHQIASALGQSNGRDQQIGIGLNYLFPINNNRAKAEQRDIDLQIQDQEIVIKNQIRNIDVNIAIAHQNVINSIAAAQKSKESLEYYKKVFENEQVKFQSGLTTLLNLILFQERLTFSELEYVQNLQQLAMAIATVRFETGTLVKDISIDPVETFRTLP